MTAQANVKTSEWTFGRDQKLVDNVAAAIAERFYKMRGWSSPWLGVTSECPKGRTPLSLQERCEFSTMAVAAMDELEAHYDPGEIIGDEIEARAKILENWKCDSATMGEAAKLAATELRQVRLMISGLLSGC